MLDVKNPEIDVEALMRRIQDKVQERRATLPPDDAGSLPAGGAPASSAMEQLLARAREVAAIGADLPAMNRTRGAARMVARPIAKAFLRIAQLITRDQRAFNFAILDAVRSLHDRSNEALSHLASVRSQITSLREELRVATQTPHLADARHPGFDDALRGSSEEIKQRVAIYLPQLREGAGPERRPILDVGCGRGELLEVLREEGLSASGVDTDPAAVVQARARGLDVAEGDPVDSLGKIGDGSLGGLTAMHLVERLPPERVSKLIDEALRVLRPGGVVILETTNPELHHLLEARGMAAVRTVLLHPGPRGYGVIGRRP
jgi:hypothetical protein